MGGDRPLAICVFCGSSKHVDDRYHELARAFGQAIAEAGHTLVFGGTDVGMMGGVARSVHEHGGKVIGVLPRFMVEHGIGYDLADELHVSDDMRDRKTMMANVSDAFVALPGGFGTLEELFEMITLNHLQQFNKPVALLNAHGFYDKLLDLFEHFFNEGFAKRKYESYYRAVATVDEAITYCVANGGREANPKAIDKWA